ncbi:MAG: DNA mismatch repair protein MutS [Acidobacteria bacterium]|nr:DNA mismatch repair protein MutS [Acidobacteriota bacterium]
MTSPPYPPISGTRNGSASPRSTYERLRAERQRDAATLGQQADRISHARLGTFLGGALLTWGSVYGAWMSVWWLAAPAAVFIALVVAHDRVLLARDRVERAVAWYEHGLARMDDRWSGMGQTGHQFVDPDHLFSQDLDLFGTGSLFQLLNTAQTRAGESALAAWLLTPADRHTAQDRQAAVLDLRPRVDMREQLAGAGADMRAAVDPATLVHWAESAPTLSGRGPQVAAVVLTVLTLLAFLIWNQGGSIALPTGALLAMALFVRMFAARTGHVLHAADGPARELVVLGAVCRIVRAEQMTSSRLSTIRSALTTTDGEITDAVRQLQRLLERHDWAHNIMFTPIAVLLFWHLHLAFAVERWRARHGGAVARWLDGIGEFEALSALSAYAYEHPADTFPEVVDPTTPPVFEAADLAHPLIPVAEAVPNDITLGAEPQIRIVSGSNMSGKTTLLRSIGVSAVMALMGAPVRARQLRLSPATLGATLRIEDSLQAGRSRFYAEVLRLGQVVDLARTGPTLCLFDELFHGTNSHDRTEGARGLIRSLLALGATGLVTTHDLALAEIADDLAPQTCNVHFDDTLVEGEMRFDYRLKPGPVTRSNALAIMRAVGLDIPSGALESA